MTKIKFCGITNLDDAELALGLGVDAIGFNFYRRSRRYIDPGDAQAIVSQLPPEIWFVGLFVDAVVAEVEDVARLVGLDTLQFHGDEDADYCRQWNSWQVIKALRIKENTLIEDVARYADAADFLLLDAYDPDQKGGTGKEIPNSFLQPLQEGGLLQNSFLAGGLTPQNVSKKVKQFQPFGVDVSSGIEVSPGQKGAELMRDFVDAVRSIDPAQQGSESF